jgi:RNA polymerase sigma-70 factor (ECF subfamily)
VASDADLSSERALDEALLCSIALGDERAALSFVRRFQSRVFGLALLIVRDRALAEDVAQEALWRVFRHADAYDPRRGAVSAWVLTITRNLAIDAVRVRRQQPTDPHDEVFARLVALQAGPEEQAEGRHAAALLREALGQLPIAQRRAVVRSAIYGQSATEIAAAEQIPLGTAKSRVRLAVARLRGLVVSEDER